ncbi:dienelactone hydrolase family protein [Candidatus Bathyarchaeota archaeon]|nr:MAG: dienelactone hydrolase family protein [Candidatus Bathyarchaeota archaeon]
MTVKSRMVEFKAEGGQGKGYLASPEKPRGAVLVLHAWWGLNDFFKSFANRLASQGFLALAPDLHDGALARTVAEAKELHSKILDERVKKLVLGAAEYLQSLPSLSGQKIGVVGFSMGAAWSLLLSTLKPENVGAVVVFYGTYPIDFSKARASYLGHFAPEDEWEPMADVRATEEKIRGAGKEVAFHFYPGTKHWFVEENRPVEYNRDAADLAWKRTLEFLDTKLR